MMRTVTKRLAGRRRFAVGVATLALGALGVSAAPALASPVWQITMAHANPYGAQASACPEGKPQTSPPCGINPLTEAEGEEGAGGNGETLARESGFNAYTITVTNTGSASTGKVTVPRSVPMIDLSAIVTSVEDSLGGV